MVRRELKPLFIGAAWLSVGSAAAVSATEEKKAEVTGRVDS